MIYAGFLGWNSKKCKMYSAGCKWDYTFCFKKVVRTFVQSGQTLLGLISGTGLRASASIQRVFLIFCLIDFGLKTIGLRKGSDASGLPTPRRLQNGTSV